MLVAATSSAKRHWFWLTVAVLFFFLLYEIRSVMLPFVLGTMIAYFLDPAADRLEVRGWSRNAAAGIIVIGFFLTLALGLLLVVPIAVSQLSELFHSFPEILSKFETVYRPQIENWLGKLHFEPVDSLLNSSVTPEPAAVMALTGKILRSGLAFASVLSLVLITPVVSFYMLRDWDVLMAKIDRMLPRENVATVRAQAAEIDRTLSGFIRGQLNVCLVLGFIYMVGLTLIGVHYGALIGLVSGLLVIIPYLGQATGCIVAMAVAWFQFGEFSHAGMAAGLYVGAHLLEANYFTPRWVGSKVGLHPVWVIFGLLAGGALFGFTGVLLAVPVTAVIGVLTRFAIERYLQSPYYHGDLVPVVLTPDAPIPTTPGVIIPPEALI